MIHESAPRAKRMWIQLGIALAMVLVFAYAFFINAR